MLNKMITKICLFVISTTSVVISTGCAAASPQPGAKSASAVFEAPRVTGTIKSPDITESSGLAASKCQPGVFWTHNDSGDDAFIYAIDESGKDLGTWKVEGARNLDWEDIAAAKDASGKCHIYIGEIGDNKLQRPVHTIYRVEEPIAGQPASSKNSPLSTTAAAMLGFTYPDKNQDAETLLVHPKTGYIYVLTKRVSGASGIYRLKPIFDRDDAQTAEMIGELSVPAIPNGFLTGGDISTDGLRAVVCDYTQAYELALPSGKVDFDDIWKQSPETVDLGQRKAGEAIAYSADGRSIFATSEGRNSPLIEVVRRK